MKKPQIIINKWHLSIVIWLTIISLILFIFVIVKTNRNDKAIIGMKVIQGFPIGEKIEVDIMTKDYMKNKKYLMRAIIDGKQVGVIYFDEDGRIRFDGDREKFEHALCKAFKIREEEWKR